MTSITNLGINLRMTTSLQSEQTTLSLLSQELASGQQNNDLTAYAPTDAHNILDFQNVVAQRQSYISSIQTVQTRLSLYDTSMTDIENIAAQAQALSTENQSFSAATAANLLATSKSYLSQVTDDLNQQVSGRYIYSGTRYTVKPVIDLNTVPGAPVNTTTTPPALPPYDSQYNTATQFSVNNTPPSGTLKVGNIGIAWSQLSNNATGNVVYTINGVAQPAIAVPGLINGNTATDLASNAAATLTALSGFLPAVDGISGLTTTAAGPDVIFAFGNTNPLPVTPDGGAGTVGDTTWLGGPLPDGTTAQLFTNPTFTVNATPTGNFSIGTGASQVLIKWSDLAAGKVTSVMVGGVATPVTVNGLSTGGTTAELAGNLSSTLNQLAAAGIGGLNNLTSTSTGPNVSISFGASPAETITPDASGLTGEITWTQGSTPDGTVTQTPSSSTAAYTADTVLIDSNFSVTYGISSDDPSFQKLINGLRFITTAVAAGQAGNPATYQADMQQASTLIASGLAGIQGLHSQVANNQNILTQETTNQNADITNLKNQLTNIQQVNLSQVGTELNLLQTQIQASYSATASIEKLSLVSYL
jgi:flagellin-like hook-associated protein FlgL